jgi:LmbE family N-acetylglucosaminyl deacetylase
MMCAATLLREFEALPFGTLHDIIGPAAPLVLAPHADDESLGCGGLIAACCKRGTPPCVVILTDGTGSHPASRAYPPDRLRALREQEARDAVQRLGGTTDDAVFLRLQDTAAPTAGPEFDAAVRRIANLARAGGCGTILAPWRHDPHCDHEAADLMAREAAAMAGLPHLAYPVWGWTLPPDHALPDQSATGWRLDIAEHLQAKRDAIAAHASQYSDLITDDPTGFRLPRTLLAVFERPYEVFLKP